MKDEYIIINKTTIQKRIEELEQEYKSEPAYQFNSYGNKLIREIVILGQILSQSTPLIPEIEKAFDAGREQVWTDINQEEKDFVNDKQDYISNLKLDI